MKNDKIKSIVTETVLNFLNEVKFKKLPVKGSFKSKPEKIDIIKGIRKKLPVDFHKSPVNKIPITKPEPPESSMPLKEEDKGKIEEVVKKILTREGLMSFTYGVNGDKAYVGARVDPTNTKNWIYTKEELLYELPIIYTESLHTFVKDLRRRLTEDKK